MLAGWREGAASRRVASVNTDDRGHATVAAAAAANAGITRRASMEERAKRTPEWNKLHCSGDDAAATVLRGAGGKFDFIDLICSNGGI